MTRPNALCDIDMSEGSSRVREFSRRTLTTDAILAELRLVSTNLSDFHPAECRIFRLALTICEINVSA